jgi:hypothetical protein
METKTNFTVKVVRELLNHGFSILLYNTEQLEDACGGYCWIDDDKRELSVAMKHHMGFEILIHEYCHFLQWKNDPKFWYSHIEKYDLLFDWINDKNMEVTEKDLKDSLESIIAIEHDCESRVLKLVKNNPIEDFDINKYIRAANSYLWSYHLNRELRQRPNNPIYTNRVIEKMSPLFCSLSYYLDKENLSENDRRSLLVEYK